MNRRSVIHRRRLPVPGYLCQTHTPHLFTPTQTPPFFDQQSDDHHCQVVVSDA
ncbi:hypothetical protein Hanom_Chr07g00634411 [Helianthus anomalus]